MAGVLHTSLTGSLRDGTVWWNNLGFRAYQTWPLADRDNHFYTRSNSLSHNAFGNYRPPTLIRAWQHAARKVQRYGAFGRAWQPPNKPLTWT